MPSTHNLQKLINTISWVKRETVIQITLANLGSWLPNNYYSSTVLVKQYPALKWVHYDVYCVFEYQKFPGFHHIPNPLSKDEKTRNFLTCSILKLLFWQWRTSWVYLHPKSSKEGRVAHIPVFLVKNCEHNIVLTQKRHIQGDVPQWTKRILLGCLQLIWCTFHMSHMKDQTIELHHPCLWLPTRKE